MGRYGLNVLIAYFTKYGNTECIAEATAESVARLGDARVVTVDEPEASDIAGAEVVFVGSPTHMQNVPNKVRERVNALPPEVLARKAVATFDTSVKTWGPLTRLTAAHRLLSIRRRLGGKRLARSRLFSSGRGRSRPRATSTCPSRAKSNGLRSGR
jgi:flavorubredoxin